MLNKSEFTALNAESIDSEIKDTVGHICKELEKNGYFKGRFDFNTSAGVVLQVSKDVKNILEQYEWNVNIEVKPDLRLFQIEVY
jgi:hypothetical protein